jgi:hypothetical protein
MTEPTGTNVLFHQIITVNLNNSLMAPGDWVYLTYVRLIPAAGAEYGASNYLGALEINYGRIGG